MMLKPVGKRVNSVKGLIEEGFSQSTDKERLDLVAEKFSVSITNYISARINKAFPNDPIARQYVPSVSELEIAQDELSDPIGDEAYEKVPGITHRYPDRVLLKPTHTCAVYCRFCFRREKVGHPDEQLNAKEIDAAIGYIREHTEVWEVVFTGGDPFVLSDRRLKELCSRLHEIPHVGVIRFHTRLPVVQPDRITQELIAALKGRAAVYVVLHCNHDSELNPESETAIRLLVDGGIPMLSQSVLLKGINDDHISLSKLFRRLVECRVKPYYLHHLDKAEGTGHFRTSIADGVALTQSLRGVISGICQPTYVLDIPGGWGKIPIGPSYIQKVGVGEYSVTDYRGRQHQYTDAADQC